MAKLVQILTLTCANRKGGETARLVELWSFVETTMKVAEWELQNEMGGETDAATTATDEIEAKQRRV